MRLLGMVLLLPAVDLSLRLFGLKRTQSLFGILQPPTRHRQAGDHLPYAQRIAELANIAGRRGAWQNTCLRQALAVQWWLKWQGLRTQLHIGAQPVEGGLDAHAWVELDGVPLAQSRILPPILHRHG
jgi:hypothetical protein